MSLLIVPTDYSPNAEKALDQALLMAKHRGDRVELLHVIVLTRYAETPKFMEVVMSEHKSEEDKLRKWGAERMAALGIGEEVKFRAKVVYSDSLGHGILERFRKTKAKLAIVGTHGVTGFREKVFGSNTSNLIGKAQIPVLAIPPNWTPVPIKKLTVCLQPEQVSEYAKLVQKWGKWFEADMEGIYFTALPGFDKVGQTPFPFVPITAPIEKPLYQELVEYSKDLKENALVMLIHKRSLFDKVFDASITKKVAGLVRVPLLALPVEED